MADAALGPQPDFTVMAVGCEETANTLTNTANTFANTFNNMAAQIRNCQNLPTVRSDNDIATALRGIGEQLNDIKGDIRQLDARVGRLEQGMKSGFRRVDVQLLNQQARLENSQNIAGNVDENLTPLYSLTAADAQPQVIPDFPSRIDDISQMDGGRVNELLRHLEQGTTGNLGQRRTRLKRAVGGYIRATGPFAKV
ncbi:hypothetical protein BU26DRAFT_526186 [Trematosphaeria pertusa]|uniref:Uncharacterized protein n=1 Tax=Trematosphaeria pertusa TaxID=390896 RepID=A0A6A6HQC7_9PLEO|nr:uncharacterized protein BU26DRAFT_526186 [Trematosphaeria pertusa]KAF2240217.1 hypothetical protein BU26DRAFT_526186 [Trematosphaeria pertusa]